MRIIDKKLNNDVEVFAIYWKDGVRHFLFIPNIGHEGFIATSEFNCEVVENRLDNFVIVKDSVGRDVIAHSATENGSLIDGLVNHDEETMKKFLINLESMNLDLTFNKI